MPMYDILNLVKPHARSVHSAEGPLLEKGIPEARREGSPYADVSVDRGQLEGHKSDYK